MKTWMVGGLVMAVAIGAGSGTVADAQVDAARGAVVALADDHAGHDHDKDGHEGPKHDLGEKEVAGYKVKVTQLGAVKPGEKADFEITVKGDAAKPKAVRAWVGVASAEGSVKAKAKPEDEGYHARVEAPKPLPEKSQVWVELETAEGKKKVGFALK